jgi:peptidyl-prolyl cis-trans isomerase B (cyclophilin B)
MKTLLIFFAILGRLVSSGFADPVAVFDVAWGKHKDRQVRSFAIAFFDQSAPLNAANFQKLVKERFYVKTAFHRVFPNYLVQGGDPLSKKKDRTAVGTGGPGYTLRAEIRRKHIRGAVAMGRLPDNINPTRQSNGSQFYVCLQAIASQDGKDTVFGEVISGLNALDEISRLPADSNANPFERVQVQRTYLIDRSELGGPVKNRR